MVWARAVEWVGRAVVRDADVSHFGVARAVERAAFDDCAPADAGADGDVDQAVNGACGAPAVFSEGGSVDVGVEHDRQLQLLDDGAN